MTSQKDHEEFLREQATEAAEKYAEALSEGAEPDQDDLAFARDTLGEGATDEMVQGLAEQRVAVRESEEQTERVREGLLSDAEADVEAIPRNPDNGEWVDIPIKNCTVEFIINMIDVGDLSDAVNGAAIQLMRNGLDSFHVLVTNNETGDRWVVHDGEVYTDDEVVSGEAVEPTPDPN